METTIPPPLQEFPLFPALPLELRLKVWSFCTPLFPRIHTIVPEKETVVYKSAMCFSSTKTWHSMQATTPITLLRVNVESRQHLLNAYADGVFREFRGIRDFRGIKAGLVYLNWKVNFDVDTLFFSGAHKDWYLCTIGGLGLKALEGRVLSAQGMEGIRGGWKIYGTKKFWKCVRGRNEWGVKREVGIVDIDEEIDIVTHFEEREVSEAERTKMFWVESLEWVSTVKWVVAKGRKLVREGD